MPVRENFWRPVTVIESALPAAFYVQYSYSVSQEIFWIKHDKLTGIPIEEVGVRVSFSDVDTGGINVQQPGVSLPLGLSAITSAFIMPKNAGTKVHTLDYLSGDLYSYSVPSGFLATAPTVNGANIYWIEFSSASSNLLTVRFMRSDAKMGNVTLVSEQEDIDTGTVDVFNEFWGPNVTTTRMQVWISHPQSFSGRKISLAFDFADGAFELGEIEDTSSDSQKRSMVGVAPNSGFRKPGNTGVESTSSIMTHWNGELFSHGAANDVLTLVTPFISCTFLVLDPAGGSMWFVLSSGFHQYNFTPALLQTIPWSSPSTIGVSTDAILGLVIV